jgi:hypothetical protein
MTEDFEIPPEGIPVEAGSRAERMWRLTLENPNKVPDLKDVARVLRDAPKKD